MSDPAGIITGTIASLTLQENALRQLATQSGRGARALALSAVATQLYLARAALAGLYGTGALPAGVE